MPNYIFTYYPGRPPAKRESNNAVMEKWGTWLGGLGKALVNPGAPLSKTKTVKSSGTSNPGRAKPMAGFSLVKANNMRDAVKLTKGCPALERGGRVVVSEMINM